MKHEFLNGDAMKEIIVDNSVDLFIMWPPYLGVDVERYGHSTGQINDIVDTVIFSKKLAKIAKNCEKALKENGSLVYILPTNDLGLRSSVLKYVRKKTNLEYAGNMVWNYYSDNLKKENLLNFDYCDVLWFSKSAPKVDMDYLKDHPDSIFNVPLNPGELEEDYGQMGNVGDTLPVPVAEHLIRLLTSPGDTVANIMGGTGSVSIAAENTDRDSIYNDISYVQLTIAKKRMEDLILKKKKTNFSVQKDQE